MTKRSFVAEENLIDDRRKTMKPVVVEKKNKYGDGAAWSRGAMIGKGSSGSVFLATLNKPHSKYSPYPPVMAVKSAEVSVSGSIQEEKEILNNVYGCANVIRCLGEEITNGENGLMAYNLLLEYASGGTLADLIKNSGRKGLPELDVKRHTRSILRGLSHIHKCGYVHCDLKPDNILLVENSSGGFRAKVADLGLAKRSEQSGKSRLDPYLRGTSMYLSPEAVVDGVQEPPSDIWAVGCIVLQMMTGKPPWDLKHNPNVEEILRNENASPCIPRIVSAKGRSFLKGCFSRKVEFRSTAEMLLDHSFLKGLVEDDDEEEDREEDEDVVSSSAVFSEIEMITMRRQCFLLVQKVEARNLKRSSLLGQKRVLLK